MELPDIPREPSINDDAVAVLTAVKHICIIGAGAGGLATLKAILDTPQHKAGLWTATSFEARENVGGIWLPAPPIDDPPLTPLYDSLTTNLPHPVMAFTSFPFSPSTPVFPRAAVVQTYLESYAAHFNLTPHIHLKTSVQAVHRDASKWKVKISTGETLEFDFLVVANGHYRVPRYPNTPGLSKWLSAKKASHSAWYRHPHDLGNTVLVLGDGPSGQDISAEMSTVATTVIRSVTGTIPRDTSNIKLRGRVTEFGDNGEVIFEDGSTESGIDYCILATGYEMSFPFFSSPVVQSGIPPAVPPLPRELYNSTYHVFPLAKHLFPLQVDIPPSSLAFMCLLNKIAPFPLLEAQARAVIHVFANPSSLDTTEEAVDIITRYEELRGNYGDNQISIAKAWHRFNLKDHEQFDYRDRLYEFATGDGNKPVVVQGWEKEMYDQKNVLRKVWVELVRSGEADEWVKGVGENGLEEWVELLRRMLKRAHGLSDASQTTDGEKPRL